MSEEQSAESDAGRWEESSANWQELHTYSDCAREGFPTMQPSEFVRFFMDHMGCAANQEVTRIEWEYLS